MQPGSKKVSTILIGQNSLQIKTYWRNKEHFIQLKSTVNQEDIFIQNNCTEFWGVQFHLKKKSIPGFKDININ